MALSLKIAQFDKQQEKLQASLAKISAPRSTPAPTPAKVAVSGKAPALAPAQSIVPFAHKFSFATEKQKRQQVASIRRAPVGAQIKRVLDLLLETRQSLPSEINDLCFVGVTASKEQSQSLKRNVRVSFDGERFAYKSKHDVNNKAAEGTPMGELKDSYLGVLGDVQAMKANGDAWFLMDNDSREVELQKLLGFAAYFRRFIMPREGIDILKELTKAANRRRKQLTKAGMKPTFVAARRENMPRSLTRAFPDLRVL